MRITKKQLKKTRGKRFYRTINPEWMRSIIVEDIDHIELIDEQKEGNAHTFPKKISFESAWQEIKKSRAWNVEKEEDFY